MHAVDRSDLIDVEPVDHLVPQQIPLARRQVGEGVLQRLLELGLVDLANVVELGVLAGSRHRTEHLGFHRDLLARVLGPHDVDDHPYRGHAHPRAQVTAPGVVGDLGRLVVARHEQLVAQRLTELVFGQVDVARARDRQVDVAAVLRVERVQSSAVPQRAGTCEIQIAELEPVERFGLRLLADDAGEVLHELRWRRREITGRRLRLGEHSLQSVLESRHVIELRASVLGERAHERVLQACARHPLRA